MKRVILTTFIVLAGCAHGVEDEPLPQDEEEPQRSGPKFPHEDENGGGNMLPCDRRETITFVLSGKTLVVKVPTLCDTTPYIEKGDPPPLKK